MYARTTRLQARPDLLERGIAHISDETIPAVREMPGWVGLSMIVDRTAGDCIVTNSWETRESMRDSAEAVLPIRDRAAEALGAGPGQVAEWEVALMHRDHPSPEGSCVRAVWLRGDPASADRDIETFRSGFLPLIEQFPGFCSCSLLVDREIGEAVISVTYDNRQSLEETRARAEELNQRGIAEVGIEITAVKEYELVLAHLHVPELV